jgi:hypothetical protein
MEDNRKGVDYVALAFQSRTARHVLERDGFESAAYWRQVELEAVRLRKQASTLRLAAVHLE